MHRSAIKIIREARPSVCLGGLVDDGRQFAFRRSRGSLIDRRIPGLTLARCIERCPFFVGTIVRLKGKNAPFWGRGWECNFFFFVLLVLMNRGENFLLSKKTMKNCFIGKSSLSLSCLMDMKRILNVI